MRILLIDDSAAYYEEFARLLADSGVVFSALDRAADSAEGHRLMASDVHDIYFVDYRLPGDTGLRVIEAARQRGVIKPIIVLTGYDHPQVDRAAEAAGANDYLPKGEFTPQMLGRAIRYAVSNVQAVRAAWEAESRLRMAQDSAEIGTWDWDIRAQTVHWSDRLYEIYGVTPPVPPAELYTTWLESLHPDDRAAAQAAATAALAGIAPLKSLFRIVRPRPGAEPEIRWISSTGEVLRDPSGRPVRVIGVNVDVTEQQQALADMRAKQAEAEASRHESEARFRTYFETASDCMFHLRVEPDGRFVYVTANPVALASSGVTLEQLRGHTPEEMLGPEKGPMMTQGLRQVVSTGQPYRFEPTWDMAGGKVTYDAVYLPLRSEAGEIVGILGIARDITERRRLEAAARQASKMEALGQLAGGVAHDFNNVLTGVHGFFELLARQKGQTERAQRLIAQGLRAAERGKALTDRLLAFSRQQPLTSRPIDINTSLNELSEMLSTSLGLNVRLGQQLAPDLWPALADRNQFELALMNLAINARDAMPLGGSLTFETCNEVVSAPAGDEIKPGDYVTVTVTDTGSGMPPDILARVLEPFFTTKEPGKGTGLGLSMVHGVMRQMGGGMTIESEPGTGTRIKLYLRRAPVNVVAATAPMRSLAAGPATLLVVDDDPDTQAVITAFAAEAGYVTIAAPGVSSAIEILATNRAVDVLIADASLPGLSGAALIARARQARPDLAVLLISASATSDGPAAVGEVFTLRKPFGKDAFDNALATAMMAVAGQAEDELPHRGGSLTTN
ncbi:MAG: response regulator [Acetobacteraceae bacterium]